MGTRETIKRRKRGRQKRLEQPSSKEITRKAALEPHTKKYDNGTGGGGGKCSGSVLCYYSTLRGISIVILW